MKYTFRKVKIFAIIDVLKFKGVFVLDQYLQLCQHILDNGIDKEDRTGTGTRSVFGYQMRFDFKKVSHYLRQSVRILS